MFDATPTKQHRILDFDSECRPMHYSEWRPESQITAIAWSWIGEDNVECVVLEQDLSNEKQMLLRFLEAYNQADIVTGHYLRKHDLPLVNDHCIRAGLPLLQAKLVSDTKDDFPKVKGLGLSQENLSTLLHLDAEKHSMIGSSWREANSLSPAGLDETWTRVVSDVRQHKELRAKLVEAGVLKTPRMWSP